MTTSENGNGHNPNQQRPIKGKPVKGLPLEGGLSVNPVSPITSESLEGLRESALDQDLLSATEAGEIGMTPSVSEGWEQEDIIERRLGAMEAKETQKIREASQGKTDAELETEADEWLKHFGSDDLVDPELK